MTSNSFGIWIREFPKKEIELLGRIKKKVSNKRSGKGWINWR